MTRKGRPRQEQTESDRLIMHLLRPDLAGQRTKCNHCISGASFYEADAAGGAAASDVLVLSTDMPQAIGGGVVGR